MAGTASRATASAGRAVAKRLCRPRVEGDRESEILDAALLLLATSGYDRLTMDAVATEAKASKATLYRRWDSKADLVMDALTRGKGAPTLDQVDTGSFRGDLIAMACDHGGINDEQVLAVMASIITALHHDREFAEAFQERVVRVKVEQAREVYARAQARGEIAADADVDIIAPSLAAIILHRAFVLRLPVDDDTVLRIIDHVVIPAATRGAPNS